MTSHPNARDELRRRWTAYAAVWQHWRPKYRRMSRPATEALLRAADLAVGNHVLDLACGVGDPAIDIARRVGPDGRVVAVDFVRAMTEATARNAHADGVTAQAMTADAEALPFPGAVFDRVTSRFGIMLVPDVGRALAETWRVLTPGGLAAFLVWGPRDESSYFSVFYDAVLARVTPPPAPPDAPGPFRFASEGALRHLLDASGFVDLTEESMVVPFVWLGPPTEAQQMAYAIGAMPKTLYQLLTPGQQRAVDAETRRALETLLTADGVRFTAAIRIVTGRRQPA